MITTHSILGKLLSKTKETILILINYRLFQKIKFKMSIIVSLLQNDSSSKLYSNID